MSDTDGPPPPHHPDAEAALISSCLTSTRALQHAATTVTPDDLYVVANRRIYAAMLREYLARERGEPLMEDRTGTHPCTQCGEPIPDEYGHTICCMTFGADRG